MSQHDFDIANQSASSARSDINNALKALASLSSGSSAPSTTYANMLWYDTSNNTLKMRAEADDAWISVGYLDQSTDTFALFDDTKVVNSSGTQTGLLGDQAEAVWEAGTGTTESLVSPAKIKAAIEANPSGLGVSQTWQDMSGSRVAGTTYTNSTGRTIFVSTELSPVGTERFELYLGGSWQAVARGGRSWSGPIPQGQQYRVTGGYLYWLELR